MKLKLLFIIFIAMIGCAQKSEKFPKTDIDMVKLHHEVGNHDRVKHYNNKRIERANDYLNNNTIYNTFDNIFFD